MSEGRASAPRSSSVSVDDGSGGLEATRRLIGSRRSASLLKRAALAVVVAGGALSPALAPVAAGAADACPNAAIRAQQGTESLADCRAYEMVSPADKGRLPVFFTPRVGMGLTGVSPTGDTAAFSSWGNFADAQGGMPLQYRARRGSDGWETRAVSPAPVMPVPTATGGSTATWSVADNALEHGVAETRDWFDPTDVNGMADVYRVGEGGSAELLSRGNGSERTTGLGGFLNGISRDGRHVIFRSTAHLVPEDAARGDHLDLYDRVDGKTYLLNQTDNGDLINRCGSEFAVNVTRNRISPDGRRVIFDVPSSGGIGPDCDVPTQIYMRVDNERTVAISASQRSVPDPAGPAPATYQGASDDGTLVFFSSDRMLTDDATSGGVYRFDVRTGKLDLLLSSSDYNGMVKISGDGKHIYFFSYYDLVPGQGIFGANNIYVWADGQLRHVVSDPTGSGSMGPGELASPDEAQRPAMATNDGRHFLFSTTVPLGSFDNTDPVTGTQRREVYLYSADDEQLTCISCDPAGQRPATSVVRSDAKVAGVLGRDAPITDDGRVVVFESGDQLVPEDANQSTDVYRYQDGRLALVSPGRTADDALLIGMSKTGRDVFFATAESLLPSDVDGGNLDMYDARIGGGFVETPPTIQVPCALDGCQGAAPRTPAPPSIGSIAFAGAGDVAGPAGASVSVSKLGVVRGTKGRLTVRVPSAGRISVSGSSVKSATASVAKAGAAKITVALSDKGRAALKRKRTLKLKVRVGFSAKAGGAASKTITVTFKQPAASARKGGR
jgi:hypothetical protein